MRKASEKDKDLVIDILSKSFDTNKSINFVVQQDSKRLKRIKKLMEYSFFMGLTFGEVFISDCGKSCSILLYPYKKKTTLASFFWDLKLVFGVIGIKNVKKVLSRESQLKGLHPKVPFIHLWYVGVYPDFQNKGLGSKLMKEIYTFSKNKKLPILLETSTERNIPFYKSLGYKIIDKLDLNYALYIFKKD
ncbi:Acetyltransferase [Tenacibaculum sp. 190524A02b]|uniref:GNAT family N-acetyltransferase n=1 Tax=Tenacibaculum vairaonense TaxID=3137860 RepID=UPI0032B112CB